MTSLRERAAWISLGATLVIWGFYFLMVWRGLQTGAGEWQAALFVECVAASLVVQLVLIGLAAARSSKAERTLSDEREIRIDGQATTAAYAALTVLVLLVALSVPFGAGLEIGGVMINGGGQGLAVMSQGLLLAIVLAEVVKCGVILGLHRWSRS